MLEGRSKTSEAPAVSVVIPVHNAEPFVAKCLDSVLAQTFDDFEVICADDASTDGSLDILKRYASHDARIKVISGTYGGCSEARNAGLDLAHGTYIAFLDSDDFWELDLLAKTVERAEETQADLVIFDYWLYLDEASELLTYRDQELFARLDGTVVSLDTCPELVGVVGAWDRLVRRSFLEEHGIRFVEGHVYEDVVYTAQTLAAAQRIAVLADHLHYYRRNVAGSMTFIEDGNISNEQDFLFTQSFAQACYRHVQLPLAGWRAYAHYFAEYAYMHQRGIRSKERFLAFFEAVRNMHLWAYEWPLFSLIENDPNPARWLYIKMMCANLPIAAYVESEAIAHMRSVMP